MRNTILVSKPSDLSHRQQLDYLFRMLSHNKLIHPQHRRPRLGPYLLLCQTQNL